VSADERARREIVERLDATMLVEAGAGTGKTRALVDRVVALVCRGVSIDAIAAITFTERAAAELRERVREGLENAAAAPGAGAEAVANCRRALAGLDRAQLSTIHSFGQVLLRAFSAEAGIDPEMTVLDQLTAERRAEERWRATLERVDTTGPEGAALDRALGLGLTVRGLRTLGQSLAEREDIAAAIVAAPPDPPRPDWTALNGLRAALAGLPLGAVTGEDHCLNHVVALDGVLEALGGVDGWRRDSVLRENAGLYERGVTTLGAQSKWGGREAIAAARNAAGSVGAALADLLKASRAEALAGILPWLAHVALQEASVRRRDGTLVFDDLILWTRDLLRTEPSVREALRERFRALLIDEFQDTDPWQVDLAESFARAPAGGLEPGRLFLVGDPKQSIYRFRRADMEVYAAERARVHEQGGLLVSLTENRRSRRVIVDWVNDVVGGLIAEIDDPALQPPYAPIAAERTVDLAGPGAAWMGGPSADRAALVRLAEAADVAATCRAAVEDGWEVQDRGGAVRSARLRDIAVLIPARTGLSALERALRGAGVPHRVEGGSLVFRTQELRDLINCLAAIDDPADEVAVVGALRSPAFACSDVELAEHRRDGLRFNYLSPAIANRPGVVAEALRCLRRHHRERHDRSLASVVERFVAERRLVEVGLVDGLTRDAYRRARFVVEQARAFEGDRPQGLRAFVAWLEERTSGPIFERDGAGVDDDEDAVRVLTVHAAKGLEFPVVVLAGIGSGPPYAQPPTVSLDEGRGVVVTIGSKESGRLVLGDVAAVEAREKRHQEAEAARLLYVAATRARDHLVISLHHQASYGQRSGAARLMRHGACERAAQWTPPPITSEGAIGPFADLPVDSPMEGDHRVLRAALVARATLLRYTSATGMSGAVREAGGEEQEPGGGAGDEPWSRGRGGSRVGRAVHACLQSLPLDAADDAVVSAAAAQAVAEAIPGRSGEVAQLVRAALDSPAAARARATPATLREVPFAHARGGVVVEGFIDVVIPRDGALEIVDWKTDDVPAAGVEERVADYAIQAGLYAAGLTQATGLPVDRITYVFLRPGVESTPGEPDALAIDALRLLDEVAASGSGSPGGTAAA
jgi:ATP-dependent exoDNAse (exonuclease V) beta subunit